MDHFSFFLIPFLGMPYIVEIHNIKANTLAHRVLFRRAGAIVMTNNLIRASISTTFQIPHGKIIVLPNGIDLSLFRMLPPRPAARKKLGLPLDTKVVVYSGSIQRWKGIEALVDAACFLPQGVRVYFVGASPAELQAITAQVQVPANIVCAGVREYTEIPLWLASADVAVVLGTRANEYSYAHTSPMKLFEYLAAGSPVVASRTPANQEMVGEGEVTFYEPDNSKDLAEKICQVLEGGPAFDAKVERAKALVGQFSWQRRAQAISKIFSR
jgi:glycosyltransferase involved in cell wall biosynthesis